MSSPCLLPTAVMLCVCVCPLLSCGRAIRVWGPPPCARDDGSDPRDRGAGEDGSEVPVPVLQGDDAVHRLDLP